MPINLAGGGRAGGVGDALLEIVKQRLLEQELNQRQQDQELSRRRQDRLDARQVEQDTYNRGRDKAGDDRQRKLDEEAAGQRTHANQIADFNVLNKGDIPQAQLNASLGEDPTTAHAVPTSTPVNLPSGSGQSFKLPAVPMQSNTMPVGKLQLRPMSMEMNDERAAEDEKRRLANSIALANAKPSTRSSVSGFIGPKGEPVQQDQEGRFYIGQTEVPPSQVKRAPPQNEQRDRYTIQQVTMADGTTGLIRVNMDTGQPESVKMPEGVAGAGKATGAEQKAFTAGTTAQAAGARATEFEAGLKGLGAQFSTQLPNLITTPSGRQYRTAEREWIETVLRPRSGAAIRPDEYDNYAAMYFVQPGDDDLGTIQMKQAARARAEKSFVAQSGNLQKHTAPVDTTTPQTGDVIDAAAFMAGRKKGGG